MIRPRLLQVSLALLIVAGVVDACSVDDANMTAASCSGVNCNRDGLGNTTEQDVPGKAAVPDASATTPALLVKPACGLGSCLPDDRRACEDYVPPSSGGHGDAAAATDAGHDAGRDPLDAGLDAGGREPQIDGSFARPAQPETAPSAFACQLSVDHGQVQRACGAAGLQGVDEPCTSAADCAPGLGCVGMVRAGRCLPFCCGPNGDDSCEHGFYCTERPLRGPEFGEADGPAVPVCDRADNCSLSEPVDCTGEHCVCAANFACSVVRPDGTTACVPEGDGEAGQPCPCKWGYHCSQATNPGTCVKTCDLNTPNSCPAGVCQATPLLPEGWGTCVGASPAQMAPPSSAR